MFSPKQSWPLAPTDYRESPGRENKGRETWLANMWLAPLLLLEVSQSGGPDQTGRGGGEVGEWGVGGVGDCWSTKCMNMRFGVSRGAVQGLVCACHRAVMPCSWYYPSPSPNSGLHLLPTPPPLAGL